LNKFFILIFLISILPSFYNTVLADSKTKTIIFRVAHGPYEVINQPLQSFKKEVEEKTRGKLKVQIEIPGNIRETNQEAIKKTFEDVISGEIQMSQIYTSYMAQFDPNFHALEMPFLFKDNEHSFAAVDGEPGLQLLASLEKNSPLKGLGFTYCGGYRSIASMDLKLESVEDFSKIKMSFPSPMSKTIFVKMGATLVGNISKESIQTALEKNDINSYETVSPRYFHNGEYKTAKVLNDLNHNIQFTTIVMNKIFFKSLTKKEQKIVSDAIFKASQVERSLAVQVATEVRINASKLGIAIVKMPDSEIKKFKDKMESVDWYGIYGISREFVEKIKSLEVKKLSSNY
jgi:TRAP-type C4-dicarboxylate transport system substrate-binding protein